MAATLFFPPPPPLPLHPTPRGEDEESPLNTVHTTLHRHLLSSNDGPSRADAPGEEEVEDREGHEPLQSPEAEGEEEVIEEDGNEGVRSSPQEVSPLEDEPPPVGTGIGIGALLGRRVTLKPRRTLSLSPTPTPRVAGDMSMARNLRAACCLDFTDKDDDDGLCHLSESESEGKRKIAQMSCEDSFCCRKVGLPRRGNSLTLGPVSGLSREFGSFRRPSSSVKRPLELTLPCQKIEYLDITYQKVGIHSVRFSPIARKKISYHPVPYHAIHYCEVNYLGERPVKRKPPS